MKSSLVDLTLRIHHNTDKAILVSDDEDEKNAKWLPLSQIEWHYKDAKKGLVAVTLPEWLAKDKGFI